MRLDETNILFLHTYLPCPLPTRRRRLASGAYCVLPFLHCSKKTGAVYKLRTTSPGEAENFTDTVLSSARVCQVPTTRGQAGQGGQQGRAEPNEESQDGGGCCSQVLLSSHSFPYQYYSLLFSFSVPFAAGRIKRYFICPEPNLIKV